MTRQGDVHGPHGSHRRGRVLAIEPELIVEARVCPIGSCGGKRATMKAYWLVAGAGLLAAVIGGVVWTISDEQLGLILVLGGMVVAVMGLVMRLLQWGVDKSK